MSVITTVFIIYLLVLVGLALWSRGEAHTVSGYFIAGKKPPPWVVAFSTNATGESGWLLLGLTGMGYAVSAHAFWVVAGEVLGIALAWTIFSRRIKRMGDSSDAVTVPCLLTARFNDLTKLLRRISMLIILVTVGAYVAAQMVATGKAFDGFTGLDYSSGVLVGATVIILYALVGCYKAVAWTDLVQGLLTSWGPEGRSTAALVGIFGFLAIAGMLGEFFTTVAWVLWLKPHFYQLLEVIPGFIVGLALTVIVSKVRP